MSRLILAAAIRLSERTAAVSADMVAWLQKEFPRARQRILLCENGVDPAFLELPRNDRGPNHEVVLTAVGSLIPRKGIDILMRALASLKPELRWQFRIVGSGPEETGLRRLAHSLGIESRVVFAGELPPAEVITALAATDIFLLGSHSEGRPNALVEAMAAALPIVASRIAGITELVEEGVSGLMPPPGDVSAWSEALETLLIDGAIRRRLGNAARQRIRHLALGWDTTARRYVQIYRSMLRD
jgi:glycosyltransferase involved in cell wall biosynthesis